ncbi:MAG: hypothetical protein C5B51_21395 [Terriglobia bacterium]|nr:MAG: hypothetical protein C5B51_21395 [Terriglobia bacterium]
MTCTYCGSRNPDGEHRCRRCGRKPSDRLAGDFAYTQGALAAVAQPERVSEPATPAVRAPNLARAVQRPLFREDPEAKVIPIASYAPARLAPPRISPTQKPAAKPSPRRSAPRVSEAQGQLDFLPAQPGQPRTLGTTVEAVIVCDAPVATLLHRGLAAALDWSMVLIGYGLFLLAFSFSGGEFALSRPNLLALGAALLLVAFTYGLFWTIAGGETPGMRWARLRLITFDGFPPEPHHRVLRFAGSCLSFCTVVGLLWSLADEESLTWQDHISRTFPTPRASESQILQRR